MPFVHAKNTFISVNGVDLSMFTKTSELSREADEFDLTTYGPNRKSHEVGGGLLGGKHSMSGVYDSSVVGPRATLRPLIGQNVTLIRRPEGTGVGKPQDTVTVHVKDYVETSPVTDYIAWAAEFTLSGDVVSTVQ